jgi:lipopolysaccharide assembly outer membrane protein LptD (OstA)
MRSLPAIASLAFLIAAFPSVARAQEQPAWEIQALNQIIPGAPEGNVEYDVATGAWRGTNVFVKYGDTTLTADSAALNQQSGEVMADGHVRIESDNQIWVGEHIRYNFKTHQMQSEQFRMGKPPVFAAGNELQGDISNKTYTARHVLVTTDDISKPAIRIRASRIKIVPGKYVEMWNAVMIMDGVPVFYFPYYHRNLGEHANNWNFMAGDSSAYGPFLLNTYDWYLNDVLDGRIHLDYRERRGAGVGPDLNLHLGRWGDATFKYYYLHDQEPNQSTNNLPFFGTIPKNRQRFYFAYQATPFTNLNVKALVNYQSDPLVLHDFFEGDYTGNPQPNTFIEVNKYWENWSLDAETTPRINGFFDQVERLPDVKLTGFRQQIFDTPVYYESESSAGYYRKMFADTNNPALPDYSAARADTFHQVLLPETFFGWLNVTPRVGGRFTYYGEESGPGGTNSETYREVFNTGAEVSFKASHLWTGATNSILDIDGLRHIIEPSANYVFVPRPSTPPSQLPQFDSEFPSLQLLPIQFPDYNDIDSIDSQNVIRFGLRNTLQTKRDGQLDNLLDWNVMLDWLLKPRAGQQTFDDLYSDLAFRPRTWLTLESQLRYDINSGDLNLAFHQLTFTPNEKWSWGIGHWYVRGGFLGNEVGGANFASSTMYVGGANFVSSTMFFRLNDNWGLRATHSFSAQTGRLQDQFYTIYRDLRSWTAALTFRVTDNYGYNGSRGPEDFTVAFTFSLKANPRHHLGDDTVEPYHLVGE